MLKGLFNKGSLFSTLQRCLFFDILMNTKLAILKLDNRLMAMPSSLQAKKQLIVSRSSYDFGYGVVENIATKIV